MAAGARVTVPGPGCGARARLAASGFQVPKPRFRVTGRGLGVTIRIRRLSHAADSVNAGAALRGTESVRPLRPLAAPGPAAAGSASEPGWYSIMIDIVMIIRVNCRCI